MLLQAKPERFEAICVKFLGKSDQVAFYDFVAANDNLELPSYLKHSYDSRISSLTNQACLLNEYWKSGEKTDFFMYYANLQTVTNRGGLNNDCHVWFFLRVQLLDT